LLNRSPETGLVAVFFALSATAFPDTFTTLLDRTSVVVGETGDVDVEIKTASRRNFHPAQVDGIRIASSGSRSASSVFNAARTTVTPLSRVGSG